jgi:hypothetical protein
LLLPFLSHFEIKQKQRKSKKEKKNIKERKKEKGKAIKKEGKERKQRQKFSRLHDYSNSLKHRTLGLPYLILSKSSSQSFFKDFALRASVRRSEAGN